MASPLRVLSVDDDLSSGQILGHLLTQAGYEVVHATNGQRAWEIVQAKPADFGVIITDHDMPLLTGLELVEMLRAANFTGRIIVHCSDLKAKERTRYVELKVATILNKPTRAVDLLDAVRGLMST